GETVGWHAGFSLAAIGMGFGLIMYRFGDRWLPADTHSQSASEDETSRGFPLGTILILMIACSLFWTAYSQSGNVLNFWLRDDSDLAVMPGVDLKITWFQAFNPLFILMGTPLLVAAWARAATRGTEASTPTKMIFGCIYLAASFFLLAVV